MLVCRLNCSGCELNSTVGGSRMGLFEFYSKGLGVYSMKAGRVKFRQSLEL